MTMPDQTKHPLPRSSTRLAGKLKIKEKNELRLSKSKNHKPLAGETAFRNDCGILPSE
jgi:hypothetical protein